MPLHVISSNHLERLFDRLCDVIFARGGDPLAPDWIVTQNVGMDGWIIQNLAARRGAAANIRSFFPLRFLRESFRWAGLGEEHPVYEREAMAFAVADALPDLIGAPEFAPLKGYLKAGPDEPLPAKDARLLSLAGRIADVFDGYLLYRHRWFDADGRWRAAPAELADTPAAVHIAWQQRLFAAVNQIGGGRHRARLAHELIRGLARGRSRPEGFPETVCVFGISYLPRLYLEFFAAAAAVSDIYLFVPNPCREFWADLVSLKKRAKLMAGGAEEDEPLYNPLLRSLGRQAQACLEALVELPDAAPESFSDAFVDPAAGRAAPTLLERLQSDILNLRCGAGESGETPVKYPAAAGDRSVTVHLCHAPLREVEVARDLILAAFDADPDLRPRDVAVMSPAIEEYAPYFPGVFGQTPAIPCAVADLPAAREEPVINLFFAILDLAFGRFEASAVLDLLGYDAVRERFSLTAQDCESLTRAVRESRVRWGWDEADRKSAGAFRANSWDWGLDRLLLGLAVKREDGVKGGLRAIEGMDGLGLEQLDGLVSFLSALYAAAADARRPHTLAEWARLAGRIFDELVCAGERALEARSEIMEAAGALAESAAHAGGGFAARAIGLAAYRRLLADRLAASSSAGAFMSGKVTVCALKPMRSIPFKVVILLGLNDGAFPRTDRRPSFDLAAARPEPGDRTRADEDRYLFLESLLAARRSFAVTCVGVDARSSQEIPPSLVVSELLEAIAGSCAVKPDELLVRHGLLPFSAGYFKPGGELFTYSGAAYQAALSRSGGQAPRPRPRFRRVEDLAAEPFAPPGGVVQLADLTAFFKSPHRALCRRCGIVFPEYEGVDDCEPIELDGLEQFSLRQALLERRLKERLQAQGVIAAAGGAAADELSLAAADGMLPVGAFAEAAFEKIAGEAALVVERAATELLAGPLTPVSARHGIEIPLDGGLRLVGRAQSYDRPEHATILNCRASVLSAKDHLEVWLEHLALSCGVPAEVASVLVRLRRGKQAAETVRFRVLPKAQARAILNELIAVYRAGMAEPIAFFPESGMTFVLKQDEKAAVKAFLPDASGSGAGDGDEPSVQFCYAGETEQLIFDQDFFGEFKAYAHKVFGPLLAAAAGGVEEAA